LQRQGRSIGTDVNKLGSSHRRIKIGCIMFKPEEENCYSMKTQTRGKQET
jgi:hypothetical protein